MAIIGKALISGVPMARAFARVSLPAGSSSPSKTTIGTMIARINGGCTIGPNRFLRLTTTTAATETTR
ncbi:hypothetical protein BAY61_26515 [Prauserella marina]|nr:hypothetical protein [Prauserella marina]ASR37975.1 hypothetical protein BAY61_26515 [Prauserella marina]